MLIGLISDTHIPEHAKALPEQLKRVFSDVELILHAGDIYSLSVLNELELIAPVLASEGDDDYSTTISDGRVKRKHILDIEGVTIWLLHQKPENIPAALRKIRQPDITPDVIVFGHTHKAELLNHDGIILVNPGSPTFPEYRLELGTVALLKVDSGKVEVEIVQLK
jgi:putative phosphoesterase